MQILLTFDYELFFGARTGSAQRTLVEPSDALLDLARIRKVPLVFFVDAAYIAALNRERKAHRAVQADYDAVCRQVERIARAGHEIQLHIHPHWEDCRWVDGAWRVNTRRYRLHDFDDVDIPVLVQSYVDILRGLAGADHAYVYRAGGWMIQPFDRLRSGLLKAGVRIDSTVFFGGLERGIERTFDFRGAPRYGHWRFDRDPCVPDPAGTFVEVPIASQDVGPAFYWRLALHRTLGGESAKPFGDGSPIEPGRSDMLRKLLGATNTVVSMDGYKSVLLEQAYRRYAAAQANEFVVIGHPKSMSPFSMKRLNAFLDERRSSSVSTFREVCASLGDEPVAAASGVQPAEVHRDAQPLPRLHSGASR